STLDADSEGEEGKFYVWTPDEIGALVDDDTFALISARYGLDQPANFEDRWHLTVRQSLEDVAKAAGKTDAEARALIHNGRNTLLAERAKRVAPGRDEKQITSWNGLAIRGLAIAGQALDRDDLIGAAAGGVDFVCGNLFENGRLLAVYKDGRARFPAYLDDYAFLLDAVIELLQARWSLAHLEFAVQLADTLLEQFEDRDAGGFWFTANDHEQLMHRPKPLADETVPSGNGIAAFALQRLGFLLGETRYLEAAERTLRAAWQAMQEYPHGHVSLSIVLDEYLHHPEVVIVRGAGDAKRWRDANAKLYSPRQLLFAIPADEKDLPGALADRKPVEGETVVYRCAGTHCDTPSTL
ncbi:MAG: thioredoxin domain-containing protein, partial [Woeseiaceae bacterium]